MSAASSPVIEYPLDAVGSVDHVGALADRLAALATTNRRAIGTAEKPREESTADLLTEVSRGLHEGPRYFEAHAQASRGERGSDNLPRLR